MRLLALILFVALGLSAQEARRFATTQPARRLALVIGNQTYARKPLRNPRADARSMESLLREDLSFTEVMKVEDGNLVAMQRAIREFVRKVKPGDLALFYYSGHGMQVGGQNWMIPTDFHADFEDDVPDQAYPAQRVLKELEDAGAGVRILILDACRDNPLPAAKRSGKDGLVPMTGAEGTYLLFATAENRTADDNPRGNNGLFTSFLVSAMKKPGITLDEAFKEARREVAAASNGRQRPWLATDIDREVVLRAGTAAPSGAPVAKPDAEVEAWEAVKNSGNAELLDQFVARYPKSEYVFSAQAKIATLRRVKAPAPPVTAVGPQPGDVKVNPKDGQRYVWIPPGQFQMGGCDECSWDEKPAHEVTITAGFWMSQTEVTQIAYERVTGQNPSYFIGADLPVEQVNWDEANSYCSQVGLRLPTEAEWEYAASAGGTEPRAVDKRTIAWYKDNAEAATHPVGKKQQNRWGLYDMLGNVWEWTTDWYRPYDTGASSNPTSAASGQYRVLRGGSWVVQSGFLRVSLRSRLEPGGRHSGIGFRCVGE